MKKLLWLAVVFIGAIAQAQTAPVAQPILVPHVHFVNTAGNPCSGCKLYSFVAGTTTAQPTYSDSTATVQNTNPVVLNVAGEADIWLGNAAYKFSLRDANGSLLWTTDNVQGMVSGGSGGGAPGGGTNEVQINSGSGGFTSIPGFTYNSAANLLNGPTLDLTADFIAGNNMGTGLNGGYMESLSYNPSTGGLGTGTNINLMACVQSDGFAHACPTNSSFWSGLTRSASSTVASTFVAGTGNCLFDNTAVVGDVVVLSTITAGQCHDAGASAQLASGTLVGLVTGAPSSGVAAVNLMHGGYPGVASNGSNGLSVSGNMQSASVNGVYDLKGAFGATGSQQTMTCTATAASNTLVGCTGGDFLVGNTIFIPSVGNAPTLATPAAPSPACVAVSGASCSGSVTYCYEVAAVQGLPNGAMTAVSAPGCVTQAAQTVPGPVAGIAAVSTQFTLATATNLTSYVIYRNVNGGSYSFYTITGTGNFIDTGHFQSVIFTCVDFGVPCTPPASPVRNDVYAQIAAINGSTVTLAPLTNMPKMWQAGTYGFTAPYLSTPAASGTVVVQHDDTPALYKASVALMNNPSGGQLKLHIPAGNYNLHDNDPYGFGYAFHLNNLNNVTIAGDGDGTKFYQYNDRAYGANGFIVGVCGNNSMNPANSCVGTGFPSMGTSAAYPIGEMLAGASTGSVTSIPDAANLAPGMYVSLYTKMPVWSSAITYSTGQMAQSAGGIVYQSVQDGNLNNAQAANPTWWTNLGSSYPAYTYGELNKVTAVDTTTGAFTLAYPASKMYSANLTAPWSVCTKCSVQPYISPVFPGPVATNIVLQDFWYRGHNIFNNYNAIDWYTKKDLTIITCCAEIEGFTRHETQTNINLTEDSAIGRGTLFMAVAAGSADMAVTNSHYYTPRFASRGQFCSEGSANITWRNNTFDINGFGDNIALGNPSNFMGGGAYCWNFDFSENQLTFKGTNLSTAFDSDGTGIAKYSNNDVTIDNLGVGKSVIRPIGGTLLSSTREPVNNTWHFGSGVGQHVNANAFTLPGYTTNTMPAQSGTVVLYSAYLAAQTVLVIPMSGNITGMNFGSARTTGLESLLVFQQPAAGGPYSLTSTFCSGSAPVLDCPNGVPVLRTAANAMTYIRIQDDGTTIHVLSSNNPTTSGLGDWSNSGASVNYVATCKTVSGGNCTSWGPAAGGGGGPILVQSVDLTGLTNNLGLTNAYTTPATVGSYLVTCYDVITTPATTSSTLPQCLLQFTDADSGVTAVTTSGINTFVVGATSARNVAGAVGGGGGNSMYIHTAPSSNIYYASSGYVSSGATPLAYALHMRIEYLGP